MDIGNDYCTGLKYLPPPFELVVCAKEEGGHKTHAPCLHCTCMSSLAIALVEGRGACMKVAQGIHV